MPRKKLQPTPTADGSAISPDEVLKLRVKRLKTLDYGDGTLEFVSIIQNLIMMEILKPNSNRLGELLQVYNQINSSALLIYKTQMEAGWDSDMDIEPEPETSLVTEPLEPEKEVTDITDSTDTEGE